MDWGHEPCWCPSTCWTYKFVALVRSVHLLDLYKFVTLVRFVHFVDRGHDPWWGPSIMRNVVLTLGGVCPHCGLLNL